MSQSLLSFTPQLNTVSSALTEAHARIQQDFAHINPVVGINQQMRASGFPADVITLDCLKTRKRILVILHDEKPTLASYQFCQLDVDPSSTYQEVALNELDSDRFYQWMRDYFSVNDA